MALAEDLDRATDSTWDRVAGHTRTYLASGGTGGQERDGVRTLVPATAEPSVGVQVGPDRSPPTPGSRPPPSASGCGR